MAEKKIRTRVQSKHDVEKNWANATFVPLPGEIIIYDKDKGVNGGTHEKPRIKVGDGTTAVGSLPFVVDKEATDAAIAAAKATVVSASEQQNFTDEQKEIARNNIDAVDANLVVSSILDSSAHPRALKIPNVTALQEFIDEYTMQQCVRNDIQQHLSEYSQEIVRSNIGAVSQAELDEAIANVDGGGSGGFVSYSITQNLTDEQKETARNNIGAVDASLVVSEIHANDAIPNGAALTNFATNNCVMAAIEQNLPDIDKRRARANIGAISQTELNEAIANAGGGNGGGGNGGSGGSVSYSVTQNLTDEQKEIARNNIDAVDANLVVSYLSRDEQIPNGAGVREFIDVVTLHDCVRCDVEQLLNDDFKQIARENIDAVDASLVVYDYKNESLSNDRIPSLGVTRDFVEDWAMMCGVVNYESQSLSPEQKEIARNNIDATGIYIGSGEMPEGYDIQIDTDGDVYSITNRITDDTNTEIPNCEAVKDYIANNITIADDGNGNITLNSSSNKVEFTDDGNGNIKMEIM